MTDLPYLSYLSYSCQQAEHARCTTGQRPPTAGTGESIWPLCECNCHRVLVEAGP
jgi:hypothetical protein